MKSTRTALEKGLEKWSHLIPPSRELQTEFSWFC